MNKIIIPAMAAVALSCCAIHEPDLHTGNRSEKQLIINSVEVAATKSLYTASRLEGAFGAMLTGKGSTDSYDGLDYTNVRFISDGNSACRPDSEILLSTTEGTLYSYYPYSEAVDDLRKIPVSVNGNIQTDYMYGTPVTRLDNSNASTVITMNHALAAIRLTIVKGTYSGKGVISKVSVNGESLATEAYLDATTGKLSGFKGMGSEICTSINTSPDETLSESGTEKHFMIIPTGESKPITFTVTIDGVDFTATAPEIDLAEGTVTSYSVTVNSRDFNLSKGYITPWVTVLQKNYEFKVY